MNFLIMIIALMGLSGVAFGTGAMRALAKVILIGGAAVVVLFFGALFLQLHP